MPVEITLSDNVADAVAGIQRGADLFVEALADRSAERFRDNVHVITGAMKASASVVTPHGSDYGTNVAAAAALNPKAEFAPEAIAGPGEAIVQVPISYGLWEEFGSNGRPAHPALVPAVESVAAEADAIAREVFGI